jgi:hypothetical protein
VTTPLLLRDGDATLRVLAGGVVEVLADDGEWVTLPDGALGVLLDGTPLPPQEEAGLEEKTRYVRTPAGSAHFGLPIGAPIVADRNAARFLAPPKGEAQAALVLIPSVEQLITGGLDPEAAVKEHRRLHHNKTVALIRARQKAEKAAGKLVAADVELPTKPALDVDADPAVIADAALKINADGPSLQNPKALYDRVAGKPAGPGAVNPFGSGGWARRLTQDTEEPVPVVGLTVERYRVDRGLAIRRKGVTYLAELKDDETQAQGLARLDAAAKLYENVLNTVPTAAAGPDGETFNAGAHLRGVTLMHGRNPDDAVWAKKYKMPNFISRATGGFGITNWWADHPPEPSDIAHELGHVIDSAHAEGYPGKPWLSQATEPLLVGQPTTWAEAVDLDHGPAGVVLGDATGLGFVLTRPGGHAPTHGADKAVTAYGAKDPREDFAEAVRLYLKDKREGRLGYVAKMLNDGHVTSIGEANPAPGSRMNIRFADIWPNRARILDAAFGLTPPVTGYQTAYKDAQRRRAAAWIAEAVKGLSTITVVDDTYGYAQTVGDAYGLSKLEAADVYADAIGTHNEKVKAASAIKFSEAAKTKLLEALNEHYTMIMEDAVTEGTFLSIEDAPFTEQLKALGGAEDSLADEIAEGYDFSGFTPDDKANLATLAKELVADKKAELAHGEALKQKLDAEAALAQATQQAAEFQASTADYPKLAADTAKKIRKKKAAVKFYAKKGGADLDEAQYAADEYELNAIAAALEELGLQGTPSTLDTPGGTVLVAGDKMVAGLKAGAVSRAARFRSNRVTARKGKRHPLSTLGYPIHDPAGNHKDWICNELADRLNNPADWEVFRAYRLTDIDVGAFDDLTPAERRTKLYGDVNLRIAKWAQTAGDNQEDALAMQHAVKDEFGLKADWGARFLSGNKAANAPPGLLEKVTQRYAAVGDWYRRIVREMHTWTQEEFAKDGIKAVGLYRGMTGMGWTPGEPTRPALQPANSWASTEGQARKFGHQVLRATIPVNRVIGTCVTGFGCLNEHEFVVMDSDGLADVAF